MRSRSSTQVRTAPERWNAIIVSCHWASVLLVVALFLTGYLMGAPAFIDIHASLGALLLFVLLLRLGTRLGTPAPKASRHRLALAAHLLLYSALAMMLITGPSAIARSAFIPAAQLFGTWNVPVVLPLSSSAGAMSHSLLAYVLMAVIAAHATAVIIRRSLGDKTILVRMLPSTLWPSRSKH